VGHDPLARSWRTCRSETTGCPARRPPRHIGGGGCGGSGAGGSRFSGATHAARSKSMNSSAFCWGVRSAS
jgi:hypothetical protein